MQRTHVAQMNAGMQRGKEIRVPLMQGLERDYPILGILYVYGHSYCIRPHVCGLAATLRWHSDFIKTWQLRQTWRQSSILSEGSVVCVNNFTQSNFKLYPEKSSQICTYPSSSIHIHTKLRRPGARDTVIGVTQVEEGSLPDELLVSRISCTSFSAHIRHPVIADVNLILGGGVRVRQHFPIAEEKELDFSAEADADWKKQTHMITTSVLQRERTFLSFRNRPSGL